MNTIKCDNCDWTGSEAELAVDLASTPDLHERLDPGSTVPAGECPKCGCFAYHTPAPVARPQTAEAAELAAACREMLAAYESAGYGVGEYLPRIEAACDAIETHT